MSNLIHRFRLTWLLAVLAFVLAALIGLPWSQNLSANQAASDGDQNCGNQSSGGPGEPCDGGGGKGGKGGGGGSGGDDGSECDEKKKDKKKDKDEDDDDQDDDSGYDDEGGSLCAGSNHFDPYTGNVSRAIRDLKVFGSVGNSPLSFVRYSNTRMSPQSTSNGRFGRDTVWTHNFQWLLRSAGVSSNGQPIMRLAYPNGADVVFEQSVTDSKLWLGPGNRTSYLKQTASGFTHVASNAVEYRFDQITNANGTIAYRLREYTDDIGNLYKVTYSTALDTLPRQIQDPAGRWLKIIYSNLGALGQTTRVLSSLDWGSPMGTWQEIVIDTTKQTASRYLAMSMTNSVRNSESLPLAELEFYDDKNVKITGTPFGSDPYFVSDASQPLLHETAKAFDADTSTYYRYAYKRNGYIGLDAGTPKKVSRIRFFIPADVVPEAAAAQFVGLSGTMANTWTVKQVLADDGRSVIYNYSAFTDASGWYSWQTLTSVSYPDGANALYDYCQVADYTRPVLCNAMDVNELGNATHISYEFDPGTSIGYLRRELSGATGEVIAETRTVTGHKAAVDYPNGKTDVFSYNFNNANVTQKVDGLGNITKFSYDQDGGGFLDATTDPLGRVTKLEHDALGNLLAKTLPDGTQYRWTRDPKGNVTVFSIVSTNGTTATTTYAYDTLGRLVRKDHPDGSYETWTYNAFGQPLTHRLPNEATESWTYDALGLELTFTDAVGAVTQSAYSASKLLISQTDALGRITQFDRDLNGRITRITYPDGKSRTMVYDDYGNTILSTDEAGHSSSHSYDEFRRRVASTDALGRMTLIDYGGGPASGGCGACNAGGKPVLVTFPNGRKVKNTYDVEWRLTGTTIAYGSAEAATTSYAYDKVGNLVKVTDPLLRNTVYQYDKRDRRIKVTLPGGATQLYAYDSRDNVIQVTNELGKVWTRTFGIVNQQLSEKDPTGRTTTYQYDLAGSALRKKATRVVLPSGRTRVEVYDALWRTVSITQAAGTADEATQSMVYDARGNLVKTVDAMGQATLYSYDLRDRQISMTDPLNLVTSNSYSPEGLLISTTSPDGTTETRSYDAAHRLLTVTDAAGQTTTYGYDVMDQLISLTDPRGSITRWTFDLSGRQKSKIYADGTQETYFYDLAGQQTSTTRPGGETMVRSYHPRGWITSITSSGGLTAGARTFTYNAAGQQLTAVIPGVSLITKTYDDAGRQISEAQRLTACGNSTFTLTYGYDADGALASTTYPDGTVITHAYNARGELTSLHDAGATPILTYTRRLDGRIASTLHRNGVSSERAYDASGRLTGIGHGLPASGLLGGESYTLDAMGRRTSRSFVNGKGDVFGYDSIGQVTAALYDSPNASQQAQTGGWIPTATWQYDAAGNRVTANDQAGSLSYSANALNQYTAINTMAPSYNANGDLLQDDRLSYAWNGRSELTEVTVQTANGTVKETHTYDALQRRISRKDATGTTFFVYDGWNVVAEYRRIQTVNVLQRRYVWGEDLSGSLQGAGGVGGLVMVSEFASGSEGNYSYHYDGNGNVVEITDELATVRASYRYDAYGRTLSAVGSYAYLNRYRFSTKPVEASSGLYYYGYRFYDPSHGRWTTRDPIGEKGGMNLYTIEGNNFVCGFDLMGMCCEKERDYWRTARAAVEEIKPRLKNAVADFKTTSTRVMTAAAALTAAQRALKSCFTGGPWGCVFAAELVVTAAAALETETSNLASAAQAVKNAQDALNGAKKALDEAALELAACIAAHNS